MLRYLDHSTLCDVTFVWFMVSWFVTRHALFVCVILKSTWLDCPRLIPFEWDPVRERYLTETAWMIFMALLSALQVRTAVLALRQSLTRVVFRLYRWCGIGSSAA